MLASEKTFERCFKSKPGSLLQQISPAAARLYRMLDTIMNKLLVFQLTVQSSYVDNVERDAEGDQFDTVQWWFSENETWRIKTFAIDQDIHTHRIAGPVAEEVAMENTMKHYEDVVERAFAVEFDDLADENEVSQVMEDLGGAPALEVARNGNQFAFWNPSRLKYTSKSRPA